MIITSGAIPDALISLLLGILCCYSCSPLPQTKAVNYLHLLNVYLLLVIWERDYCDLLYRHRQNAGTQFSASQVKNWAKRPFAEKDLFIVGEAYQPIKGWIEGALQSAQNALSEGWGIENDSHLGQGRESKQDKGDDNFDLIPFPWQFTNIIAITLLFVLPPQ